MRTLTRSRPMAPTSPIGRGNRRRRALQTSIIAQLLEDSLQHLVHSLQHFVIPESDHAKAGLAHMVRSHLVVFLRFLSVLAAVDLDYQLTIDAAEIGEIRSDRMLPAEFEALQAFPSQSSP